MIIRIDATAQVSQLGADEPWRRFARKKSTQCPGMQVLASVKPDDTQQLLNRAPGSQLAKMLSVNFDVISIAGAAFVPLCGLDQITNKAQAAPETTMNSHDEEMPKEEHIPGHPQPQRASAAFGTRLDTKD